MTTISPEYRTLLEQMHNTAPWGTKGYKYEPEIRAFLGTLPKCETIEENQGNN